MDNEDGIEISQDFNEEDPVGQIDVRPTEREGYFTAKIFLEEMPLDQMKNVIQFLSDNIHQIGSDVIKHKSLH